jgi:hypothetical protein
VVSTPPSFSHPVQEIKGQEIKGQEIKGDKGGDKGTAYLLQQFRGIGMLSLYLRADALWHGRLSVAARHLSAAVR